MLKNSAKDHGCRVALRMRKEEGGYRQFTYNDFYAGVLKVGAFLIANDLKQGEKVAILSENRPEWTIAYFAVVNIGGVTVPFDPKLTPEELSLLIKNSETKLIFVSDAQKDKVENIKNEALGVQNIFSLDSDLQDILSREIEPEMQLEVSRRQFNVGIDDLMSIIYTSGTTGSPKGVMLTHKNVMSNVIEAAPLFDIITSADNFLSVLPAYHTFETTAGMFYPIFIGASVTYAESLKSHNILRNMQETKVSIMCGVPLLYRLFLDGIKRQVEEKGPIARFFFNLLAFLSMSSKKYLKVNIGKVLFSFVHKVFGGNIKFFVSGGAALDPELIKEFDLIGFTILQGYGLTETSPILSACRINDNVFGSVGKPLPGVELKINEPDSENIGEIIAKGPNIMQGYYKNKKATDEVIRNDWFYTGDLGKFDALGNLYITGRTKDVIVLGSGVNVYPDEVESVISKSPFIKEVCVFGLLQKEGARKGMESVCAAIMPDSEYFEKKFGKEKIEKDPDLLQQKISEELDSLGKHLAEYKRVSKFFLTNAELPKTATKKIKRFLVKRIFS